VSLSGKLRVFARSFVFLCILVFVSVSTYNVLAWKDSAGIIGLNRAKHGTIDVLFAGSSHSYCSINTAWLWNEYGMAADDISDGGQALGTTYCYLVEALKTQRPSVVLVELKGLDNHQRISDGNIYRNTLNMRWSKNYLDNRRYALYHVRDEAIAEGSIDTVSKGILLKFPVIHTRYDGIRESRFANDDVLLRFSPNWTAKAYPVPKACGVTEAAELTENETAILDRISALSEKYGFKLIFWVAPFVASKAQARQYNAVEQYAADHGIDFYNFLKITEESGFDFATDIRKERYNGSHVNVNGARKITNYLGKILHRQCDLPDRRNDPEYERYNRMAREWDVASAAHELDAAENLDDYMSAIDYTLFDVTLIIRNRNAELSDFPLLNTFAEAETKVRGLYTGARRNGINGAWELSDRVKIVTDQDDTGAALLYNGSGKVSIGDCDFCLVVIDRQSGEMIEKSEFKLEEDIYEKV